jgi:hypothetical protein
VHQSAPESEELGARQKIETCCAAIREVLRRYNTDHTLDDLNGLSEFAQADLRIKVWNCAAAALRDELKDPAL